MTTLQNQQNTKEQEYDQSALLVYQYMSERQNMHCSLNGFYFGKKFETFLEKQGTSLSKLSPEIQQHVALYDSKVDGIAQEMNETGPEMSHQMAGLLQSMAEGFLKDLIHSNTAVKQLDQAARIARIHNIRKDVARIQENLNTQYDEKDLEKVVKKVQKFMDDRSRGGAVMTDKEAKKVEKLMEKLDFQFDWKEAECTNEPATLRIIGRDGFNHPATKLTLNVLR